MGTRWRGLLALQNEPTADGRRFQTLSTRTLPLGTKWQRVDAEGHDDSVVVADFRTANLGTAKQAVEAGWISPEKAAESKLDPDAVGLWGSGEMFDDVDPEVMPRLAEDVAEAMTLLERGVISPSIDAIAVGAVMLVEPGEDQPPTQERMDELFQQYEETGVEPEFEVLFAEGLVAAATLVVTPAFSEVRPFELLAPDQGTCPDGQHMMPDGTCMPDSEMPAAVEAASQRVLALTAAVPPRPPADLFADPEFSEYTELAVTERPDGLLQVAGHVAPHGACHLGVRDVCVAPPLSQAAYIPFHRHVVELDSGELLGVGRITTGFGQLGTGCRGHQECRGKDDHACSRMSLAEAVAHHDRQTPLAWVRAGEDEHGIYLVGVADASLSTEGRALLEGRKFSGDWREHGAALELVEVLALASGTPAFPAPRTHMRGGRQSSLVAAFRPPVDRDTGESGLVGGEWRRLARLAADYVVADLRAAGLAPTMPDLDGIEAAAVTAATTEQTGAMVALVPSEADAARLAVDGGEPAGELHLTLSYLGEADQIDQETRNAIIEAAWNAAEAMGGPVEGDGFSVSVFNPDSDSTAIVIGVGGQPIADLHASVTDAVAGVFTPPEQHAPYNAHITVAYSDDLSMVEELADSRTGPIVFDRVRIAFAGEYTDVLLGPAPESTPADQAAAVLAEVEAALAAVGAHERAREAAGLLRELEAVR